MTASSRSRASGRSSLAMTGTRMPSVSITARTAAASSGDRTNDRATRSTPSRRAKRRSSTSLSVRDGVLTATPGRFMPLWSRIVPPRVTTHSTSPSDPGAGRRQDPQLHRPVGQEDRVAGADVVGQGGVGRREPIGCAGGPADADRGAGRRRPGRRCRRGGCRCGASGPGGRPGCRRPARRRRRRPARRRRRRRGRLPVAVGEVEPGDVHPGRRPGRRRARGPGGRPDGADDLGPAARRRPGRRR